MGNALLPPLKDRQQLIAALKFASIIEQMLACEYLFAAFSARKSLADYSAGVREDPVKRLSAQAALDTIRPWLAQIYTIARQEMEHLGIVQNLLAALGEEPYLMRPAFPVSAKHTFLGAPFVLQRLERASLHRFIWYERPDYLTAEFERAHGPRDESHFADIAPSLLPPFLREYDSVTKLYSAIQTAFATLPPGEIFQGDPARQIGQDLFSYRIQMMPVSNRESAAAAIGLVMEQGEGIGESPQSTEPAHFERFLKVLRGLDQALGANCAFDPALPVVLNPWVGGPRHGIHDVDDARTTLVTNPHAQKVMRLFDDSYSLMLVMMKSFFGTYSGYYQPEPRPQAAMFYAAFFPLMTMVVRPLGEIIARMPAAGGNIEPEADQPRAGASFQIDADVIERREDELRIKTVLDADYYRDALGRQAAAAKSLIGDVPADERANMEYLHENLLSTSLHLESIWREGR